MCTPSIPKSILVLAFVLLVLRPKMQTSTKQKRPYMGIFVFFAKKIDLYFFLK